MGFRTIPITLLIIFAFYYYLILLRVDRYWKLNLNKIVILLIVLIIILPAFNFFGIWFLLLLHLFEIGVVIEILNLIFKRFDLKYWNFSYNNFLLPIVLTVIIFCYGYYNINSIEKTEYSLKTDKNIDKNNFKIGFISDVHFGNSLDSMKLSKVVDKLSEENLDILLLGGDIVDESTTLEELYEVFNLLGKTKTEFGIFFVYGNHDMSRYRNDPNYTIKDLQASIKSNNITILDDESVEVNKDIIIIGRRDRSLKNRKNSQDLIKNVDTNKFLILLDHQPVELENNAKLGYDLQLSGHTHNGQLFPFNLIIKNFNLAELIYGNKNIDNFNIIVSSGLSGWGYPLRTAGKSEYLIIDIH